MRNWILSIAILVSVFLPAVAYGQARPAPTPTRGGLNLGLPTTTFEANSRDTTLNYSWSKVELNAITQPTADSLRFYSSSTADSTKVRIVGLDSSGVYVSDTSRVSGTDSVFVASRKYSKLIAIYCDTASAGTLSFKIKTATAVAVTIPVGQLQTYIAEHWFGTTGGTVTELTIFPESFSPKIDYELRLYRHQANSISAPNTGYSLLWSGTSESIPIVRPHVSKQIVAALNDTSKWFLLASPGTAFNYASVTTSVATTNVAHYVVSSPDTVNWDYPGTAIDSLSSGTAQSSTLRYKAITLGSATGPYYRFVLNGKAAAGDTSTITTYVFPAAYNTIPKPLVFPMDERCPAMSTVVLYAKAYGVGGRISAKVKGTITR